MAVTVTSARQRALAGAAAGVLAALVLAHTSALPDRADLLVFDAQVALLRALPGRCAPPAAGDVAIVGIDDGTLDTLGVPMALLHEPLGLALQAIAAAGPSVVGLDLALPEQSFESLTAHGARPGAASPLQSLLQGLLAARAGPGIVVALDVGADGRVRLPAAPLLEVAGGAAAFGLPYFPVDADGAVRRFVPDPVGAGPPTFAARLAQRLDRGQALAGAGWIDYSRGAALDYVPLQQVLRWSAARDAAHLAAAFHGRPVLVGSVLPQLDRLRVPAPLAAGQAATEPVPGVVLNAHVLRGALGAGLLRPAGTPWPLCLLLLGSLAALPARALWRWTLALGLGGAIGILSLLLHARGVLLPVSSAWFALAVAAPARTALDLASTRAQLRNMTAAFGGYVSPGLLQALAQGRAGVAATEGPVAMLFADLRDFTARSEVTPPAQMLATLNLYLERITPRIHALGGTIDNFRGDGIMALFGAPDPLVHACDCAFEAAGAILAETDRLNRTDLAARGVAPLEVGIGMAYGDVVYGELGSADRRDFTALGDAVNVAARLQDLTRVLQYPVLMSAQFARALHGRGGTLVMLGRQELKGHSPVEVVAWRPVDPVHAGAA